MYLFNFNLLDIYNIVRSNSSFWGRKLKNINSMKDWGMRSYNWIWSRPSCRQGNWQVFRVLYTGKLSIPGKLREAWPQPVLVSLMRDVRTSVGGAAATLRYLNTPRAQGSLTPSYQGQSKSKMGHLSRFWKPERSDACREPAMVANWLLLEQTVGTHRNP